MPLFLEKKHSRPHCQEVRGDSVLVQAATLFPFSLCAEPLGGNSSHAFLFCFVFTLETRLLKKNQPFVGVKGW